MIKRRNLDKETILNVAAELAEEIGLEHVTLKQLAEKLDIKTPSLYNHLNGLNELMEGLAQLAIQRMEITLQNAAIGKAKKEAFIGIANAYRKFAKENPQLYKTILKIPVSEDKGLLEEGIEVVRILYKVMEPYHYLEEDTIHFIRGFRSALHGFVSLEEAGFFKGKVDLEKSFDIFMSSLISTLVVKEEQ